MSLGDYAEDAMLDFTFTTFQFSTGAPAALASGALAVYKQNSTTQSTAGITLTASFDSVTGLNHVRIDLSADAFYATGADYSIVLTAGTVDSVSVVGATIETFSIQNRYMRGTNSAATAAQATAIETDTQDIQSRIPAALVGGRIDANVGAISSDATAADNAEAFFDGTGYAGTNNVIPTVTNLTNLPSIPANWLTAAGTAADFTTEIQAGLATAADLATVAGYLDTEIAAILEDTGTTLPAQIAALPTAAENAAQTVSDLGATAIPVNITKVNGTTIDGAGTTADPWGPV